MVSTCASHITNSSNHLLLCPLVACVFSLEKCLLCICLFYYYEATIYGTQATFRPLIWSKFLSIFGWCSLFLFANFICLILYQRTRAAHNPKKPDKVFPKEAVFSLRGLLASFQTSGFLLLSTTVSYLLLWWDVYMHLLALQLSAPSVEFITKKT